MDIVRLPVMPQGRPAAASPTQTQQPRAGVGRVEVPGPRQRSADVSGPVVQGELLEKQGERFQSTRAFITERSLERARPAGAQPESLQRSRPAISRYLNHSRPESIAELSQGRSLDLLV